MITSVRRTLVMQLVTETTGRLPVTAHLAYRADDPFAVTVTFGHDGLVLARWRLDREMLAEGIERPVGEGDVRISPRATGVWREVRLEFFGAPSPDGDRQHAMVLGWAPAVLSFLDETHRIVPPGEETVALDGFLAEVIAGG
ncbi:SsgA family sporulation/cell division regulator [Streptomyces sp. NPDC007084]|uniref:SsgA family sporulation/cell division regulator n=1 Tax=Streptomyces sp. NPDC007084 TaxID=3154313 RepID=UPI0034521193